jgi:AcrR family transcriptional regulator
MTSTSRPLRADAERNRQAIVCAAAEVFATEGANVTLEHIAQVAQVGVGTIYRRFPTVADLVSVVLEEKMTRYADHAEAQAEAALVDPGQAFRDFLAFLLEEQSMDLAFTEIILSPAGTSTLFRSEIGRSLDASIVIVDRAKAAGAIRADFDHSDLYMIQLAHAGLVRGVRGSAVELSRRFGQYMLQAFTADGLDPLPDPPAAWTRAARARRPRAT